MVVLKLCVYIDKLFYFFMVIFFTISIDYYITVMITTIIIM
jgi:hypothetical protein